MQRKSCSISRVTHLGQLRDPPQSFIEIEEDIMRVPLTDLPAHMAEIKKKSDLWLWIVMSYDSIYFKFGSGLKTSLHFFFLARDEVT